jgi:hypothetical protein
MHAHFLQCLSKVMWRSGFLAKERTGQCRRDCRGFPRVADVAEETPDQNEGKTRHNQNAKCPPGWHHFFRRHEFAFGLSIEIQKHEGRWFFYRRASSSSTASCPLTLSEEWEATTKKTAMNAMTTFVADELFSKIPVGRMEVRATTAPVLVLPAQRVPSWAPWLGWAYLAKKSTARRDHAHRDRRGLFSIHTKHGLLNRLPTKVSFSVFD